MSRAQRRVRPASSALARAALAAVLASAVISAAPACGRPAGPAPAKVEDALPQPAPSMAADGAGAPVPPGAASSPSATPSPPPRVTVEVAFPNLVFSEMVQLVYLQDGSATALAALRSGVIARFPARRDAAAATAFLDLRDQVDASAQEMGLLGLALDPDFKNNGHFYVSYTASSPPRSVVSRFALVSGAGAADPGSELVILEVRQPFSNHNGGHIAFGPDGYLYVGLGDGGGAGDPLGNGQSPSTLLGAMLRLDVSTLDTDGRYAVPPGNPFRRRGDGWREEVWAYGFRNPWRFSFDRATGSLWAGDVGQNRYEEIDVVRAGLNYGWKVMEGLHCFGRDDGRCDRDGLEPPVFEYDHDNGCSVTGGYVYRGAALPDLYGAYVFGDFCSGKVWALRYEGVGVAAAFQLADTRLRISSFAEDAEGEVYLLDFQESGGQVYRLVAP